MGPGLKMKVYLVYLPRHSSYSYSGYDDVVEAVFLDEEKAKNYVAKLNLKIRSTDRDAKAFMDSIVVTDYTTSE